MLRMLSAKLESAWDNLATSFFVVFVIVKGLYERKVWKKYLDAIFV